MNTHEFDFASLPVQERAELAHRLWESVQHEVAQTPLSADQLTELEKRVSEYDQGLMTALSLDTLKLMLRERRNAL